MTSLKWFTDDVIDGVIGVIHYYITLSNFVHWFPRVQRVGNEPISAPPTHDAFWWLMVAQGVLSMTQHMPKCRISLPEQHSITDGLKVVLPQHFLLAPIFLYGNLSGYSPQHWVEGPWSSPKASPPVENRLDSPKPSEKVSNSKLPDLTASNCGMPPRPLPPLAACVVGDCVVGDSVVVGSMKSESKIVRHAFIT